MTPRINAILSLMQQLKAIMSSQVATQQTFLKKEETFLALIYFLAILGLLVLIALSVLLNTSIETEISHCYHKNYFLGIGKSSF